MQTTLFDISNLNWSAIRTHFGIRDEPVKSDQIQCLLNRNRGLKSDNTRLKNQLKKKIKSSD